LRTRDEFLAAASHDLKNPLASIKATAQLMRRRLDREAALDVDRLRDGLARLDTIATRAAGQVEELLDTAQLQMGRPLDLDRRPTDLIRLVREVLAEQQTSDRHTLRLETTEDAVVGMWDMPRLGRVVANLIDNAVKYSPNGGHIVVRASVERADARDVAILEVQDAGIGIPAQDIERVFDRFQRASNVEGRIGGTGIGLASVRHIVASHGGSIDVHSEENRGSVFRVHLPLLINEGVE
jgi:signal transduction histidine kinase